MSPERERRPGVRAASTSSAGQLDERKATPPTIADLEHADIDTLARVLGASYDGGPFACPNRWCIDRDPVYLWPMGHTRSCCVQRPGLARCFACGRDFPLWRLRRAVLEDGRLVRALAREIGAAA